jgi:hypothetical protein
MKFFAEKLKAQFLRSKTKKYGVYGINSKLNFRIARLGMKFFAEKLLNSIFAQQKMSRSLKNGQR